MEKSAKVYDYQARAREFKVNDWVVPFGANPTEIGRITQIWPGIAQADIEFSHTSLRLPVEDLKKINKPEAETIPPETVSIPGGLSLTSVSAGPETQNTPNQKETTYHPTMSQSLGKKAADRVAKAFMEKQGLYWHKSDRNYRSTKTENATKKYCCPKRGCGGMLKKSVYKRRGGVNGHLYACPECLFIIKDENIHNGETQVPPTPDPVVIEFAPEDQEIVHEILANEETPDERLISASDYQELLGKKG